MLTCCCDILGGAAGATLLSPDDDSANNYVGCLCQCLNVVRLVAIYSEHLLRVKEKRNNTKEPRPKVLIRTICSNVLFPVFLGNSTPNSTFPFIEYVDHES